MFINSIFRFPRPGRSAPADLTELPSSHETYVTAMPGDGSLILSDVRAPQARGRGGTPFSGWGPGSVVSQTVPEVVFARDYFRPS